MYLCGCGYNGSSVGGVCLLVLLLVGVVLCCCCCVVVIVKQRRVLERRVLWEASCWGLGLSGRLTSVGIHFLHVNVNNRGCEDGEEEDVKR